MFSELMEVIRLLRRRCPWDRKQTVASTRPLILNETYELDEALRECDKAAIAEELGDYLFMGLFHADVAGKELGITLEDSLKGIVAKLKQRHPHIYGTTKVRDAEEVLANWERIKRKHKKTGGLLSSIPVAMPALQQAQLIQERCRRVGFDWDKPEQVLDKVEEEIGELRQELGRGRQSRPRIKEELGDLFLALARHLDVDAEGTLKDANAKFRNRFRYVEEHFVARGRELGQVSLDEMEEVWQEAKSGKGKGKMPKSGSSRQEAKLGKGKGEMPKSEKGRGRKAKSGRK
jgi:MazG family protein